jgi:hypothetical protein
MQPGRGVYVSIPGEVGEDVDASAGSTTQPPGSLICRRSQQMDVLAIRLVWLIEGISPS